MSTKLSTGRVRPTYEFIKANRGSYRVQAMCRILGVAPSGYYEWLTHPISKRAREDARLLRLIRASFTASQGIYDAPRVFLDLREAEKRAASIASPPLVPGSVSVLVVGR